MPAAADAGSGAVASTAPRPGRRSRRPVRSRAPGADPGGAGGPGPRDDPRVRARVRGARARGVRPHPDRAGPPRPRSGARARRRRRVPLRAVAGRRRQPLGMAERVGGARTPPPRGDQASTVASFSDFSASASARASFSSASFLSLMFNTWLSQPSNSLFQPESIYTQSSVVPGGSRGRRRRGRARTARSTGGRPPGARSRRAPRR